MLSVVSVIGTGNFEKNNASLATISAYVHHRVRMNFQTDSRQLAIIILTFRRDDILAAQASRLEALYEKYPIFDVVLIDNNADDKLREEFFVSGGYRCNVLQPGENAGVSGGRNHGIRASSADLLVFWDDDAIVDADFPLDQLVSKFAADPKLGALAFRSVNPSTGRIDPIEFPHTDKSRINETEPFQTFRYIGVGHAIRRSAIAKAGVYDETFFYGMEEFDQSFRILNAGYKIVYDPGFSLEHHKHQSGRILPRQRWVRSYSNKLKLAYKNLPVRYAIGVSIVWFLYITLKTRSITAPFEAISDYRKWLKLIRPQRSPITKSAISYIKDCGGNLYV